MRARFLGGVLSALASSVLLVGPASAAPPAATARAGQGQVVVVQAAPGRSVTVSIDGRALRGDVHVGAVLGPYRLAAGTHRVAFVPATGPTVAATMTVRPGSSSDVVLHFPAEVGGDAVVTSYRTPLTPIGPGKARLMVAHTATVAPADVRFDHVTVFRHIANGEFAEADVPEGSHQVALVPAGTADDQPLLGPLSLTLAARTVTMVYAVGRPANGSMDVITHTVALTANGALAPRSVKTGSAGLAADVHVTPFSDSLSAPRSWLSTLFLRLLLCGTGTAPH